MIEKIKVVWLCHLSNEEIRRHLTISNCYFLKFIATILHKQVTRWNDFAIWNTNAIKEFEKYIDVDLTVVFPFAGIKGETQGFNMNGVRYIAFRSEDDHLIPFVKERLFGLIEEKYKKNRALIMSIINKIEPDIVHVIGAENPYYSSAALDIPDTIPCVVSLQTLISFPSFAQNYPISKKSYMIRSAIEKEVIRKCGLIASRVEYAKKYIRERINPNAIFLQMPLALGVDIDVAFVKKQFDFVYFAANINKAADYAIEAFALAHKKYPNITLNISGAYDVSYKHQIEKRVDELGLTDVVYITGPLKTHDQVLHQIKKSRFALLPLKVDLISGTIREAMACGLPVVTTITPSTPKLNKERMCVLLSEKGDFQLMADNMVKLIENEKYASLLRDNAIKTISEKYSNEHYMRMWRKGYYEILDNFRSGTAFSDSVISK